MLGRPGPHRVSVRDVRFITPEVAPPGTHPDSLGLMPTDSVIVSNDLPLFYVHALITMATEGRLRDVRLWIPGEPPPPEAIGLRHRPWLREILVPKPLPPDWGPAPAPVRVVNRPTAVAGRPRFEEQPDGPAVLQIQTVTGCRATCGWCPIGPTSPPEVVMADDVWAAILEQLAALRPEAVELFFHAEPLLDPHLERRADDLAAACPDALTSIVTHESALTTERAQRLCRSGLDVVFVSVNVPGTPTADRLVRRLRPLSDLAAAFRARGKALVLTTLGNFFQPGIRTRFRKALRTLDLNCETFVATSRAGDVDLDRWASSTGPTGLCHRPFHKAYVRVDGRLGLCCEDWQYRVDLGDLTDRPLAELWGEQAYRDVRYGLLDDAPVGPCRRCDFRRGR